MATATVQHLHRMLMEGQFWPPEKLLDHQRHLLEQLLRHAKSTVPFYETRLNCVFRKNGSIDWNRWEEIPILTREDLREHKEALLSRIPPEAHGETRESSSSGTSGLSVTITHNMLETLVSMAAVFRAATWQNLNWADNCVDCSLGGTHYALWPDGLELGQFGLTLPDKSNGRVWAINRQVTPADLCHFLVAKKAMYLTCRPKTAHAAALEAIRLGIDVRLDAVLGHGTGITEEESIDFQRAFGARAIGIYSSTECGKIAHQCRTSSAYHVNAETHMFEITDEQGAQVEIGNEGRTIITPFYSTAQPLIRYDQGDIASMGSGCSCGTTLPVIAKILGRTSDLFHLPDGRRISLYLPPSLKKPLGTEFWQLAQTGPLTFEVRYQEYEAPQPDARQNIIRNMKEQISSDIEVRFVKLESLPFTAGGKFLENVREFKIP